MKYQRLLPIFSSCFKSFLLKRIFTGIFLFIFFLFCLYKLNFIYFECVFLFLLLLCLLEWSALIRLKVLFRFIYVFFVFYLGYLVVLFDISLEMLIELNFFAWIFGLICICFYNNFVFLFRNSVFGFFFGILIFIPWWFSFNYLNIVSSYCKLDLFFVCSLIFCADIFAYFFGSMWGKKRLMIKASPNKTWIGVFAALISTIILVFLNFFILNIYINVALAYLGFSFFIVFFSVVGDLVESMFKRGINLKDSGNILPGHGGVLDRLDSLLPAIPMFLFFFKF
ncbi:MAG TPA: phosphatidate cytidylyltransferase [Candidatus Azoamicus sp. OHIO1]